MMGGVNLRPAADPAPVDPVVADRGMAERARPLLLVLLAALAVVAVALGVAMAVDAFVGLPSENYLSR
jgi:hypothetical protein